VIVFTYDGNFTDDGEDDDENEEDDLCFILPLLSVLIDTSNVSDEE
jgi:hypothetical protein